jgi:hypothetical protein
MQDMERANTYAQALVEPLKDTKGDVSEKTGQLSRVAEIVQLVGYKNLSESNRRNIETIVVSLITSKQLAWSSVVEEGWEVLAAIALSHPPMDFQQAIAKAAEALGRARLTASLVESITVLRRKFPYMDSLLYQQLNNVIHTVLRIASQSEGLSTPISTSTASPSTPFPQQEKKPSIFGRMFWRGDGKNDSTSSLDPVVDEDSVIAALEFLRVTESGRIDDVSQIAEEMRINVVPLLRHASVAVRKASATTIVDRLLYCTELNGSTTSDSTPC